MKTTAYGAPELKLLQGAYLLRGFTLSLILHGLIVGGLVLLKPGAVGTLSAHGGRQCWPDPHHPLPVELTGVMPPDQGPPKPIHKGPTNYQPVDKPQPDSLLEVPGPESTDPGTGNGPGTGTDGNEWNEGSGGIDTTDTGIEETAPFEWAEEMPKVILARIPEYPEIAVRSGIGGRVLVKMWVDKFGRVKEATVELSTADILNDAALEAARQYLFRPAVMNNHPVPIWLRIPFVFTLKGK